MNRFISQTALAVAISFTLSAQAEDRLEELVVTAARVAQPIDEVIGSVTVIDRDEIQRRQAQSLVELLRGEAGIELVNTGGLGKLSNIFVRGANSTQTLVLIDGVRVGSATSGSTRIEFIPVEQIERIEIVRGPRSSLYGADAVGGVIQIFTRKNSGVNASISTATYNTQSYTAGFGISQDQLTFSAQGAYQQSVGFNSCLGSVSAACYTIEPDRDGYRNSSASARFGYDFGKVEVQLSTLYSQGFTEYDGDFGNETRFVNSAPSARVQIKATDTLTVTLQGGVSLDKNENFQNSQFMSRFETNKRIGSAQLDWSVATAQLLSVGVDDTLDRVDSDLDFAVTRRRNTGVYGQYLGKLGDHQLSASTRYDDNEQFGSKQTGSIGWKWLVLGEALAINAGAGTAFHAPTFNDLYYPFGSGNPDLRPEKSRSVEAGIGGAVQILRWSLQAYQNDIRDLIVLDSNYLPGNLSQARLRGAELTGTLRGQQVNLSLTYTAQQAVSRAGDTNFNHQLPRRSRHAGRAQLGYDFGQAQVTGELNVVGKRFDDLANTQVLGGYTTVDLRTDVQLPAKLALQVRLGNLFDRTYQTVNLYSQPGRTWSVTVRYPQ